MNSVYFIFLSKKKYRVGCVTQDRLDTSIVHENKLYELAEDASMAYFIYANKNKDDKRWDKTKRKKVKYL